MTVSDFATTCNIGLVVSVIALPTLGGILNKRVDLLLRVVSILMDDYDARHPRNGDARQAQKASEQKEDQYE
jgi:hypothetical protein